MVICPEHFHQNLISKKQAEDIKKEILAEITTNKDQNMHNTINTNMDNENIE